ncbi:hypothetical protein DV736_g2767, partial [Chaetothyriales sp. CBS 134916]
MVHSLEYPKKKSTTLNRYNSRGTYDLSTIHTIVNSTNVLHVSFPAGPDDPFPAILPMIGALGSFKFPSAGLDEPLDCYLHGYVSARLVRLANASDKGLPVSIAATKVDGLVLSLTPNSHSYNYRSAVLQGYAKPVETDTEKIFAMELITNKVVPQRWQHTRTPPDKVEMTSTVILRVSIEAGSGKVRHGEPHDDAKDLSQPDLVDNIWTGVLPLYETLDIPIPAPTNKVKEVPQYIADYVAQSNDRSRTQARDAAKDFMPKPRRESGARADTRPAFARPPGAPAAAPRATVPSSYDEDDYDFDESPPPRSTPRKHAKARPNKSKNSPAPSPAADIDRRRRRRSERRPSETPVKDRAKYSSGSSNDSGSHLLSTDALAKLNAYNEGEKYLQQKQKKQHVNEKQYKNLRAPVDTTEQQRQRRKRKRNRNVSGAILEEGRGAVKHTRHKSHYYDDKGYEVRKHKGRADQGRGNKSRKWWWILGAILVVALIVIIAVAVAVSHKSNKKSGSESSGSATTNDSGNTPTNQCDSSDVPASAKGNPYTDSSLWADSTDFNCTYTAETVGGLSIMGLDSSWDDTSQANDNVPPLNQAWQYGKMPVRGVNVGGWLSIEPFITPSLFNYPASANVVDEYTLSSHLNSSATRVIESHYATFITKQTFEDIKNAGLDHVRIPYPYWLVQTYPGDPYIKGVGWRYLLRAIEYCRQNGLRVNLDLHAVPGSQNGWTHSGRLGSINWIVGTDGATNAQRSLDIHKQLSTFFAQPRYKNVVTIYGLVNEPKMIIIPQDSVLSWNKQAIAIIRGNGLTAPHITFADGFLALSDWQAQFQGVDSKLILDTHQYQIFNTGQLNLSHVEKIKLACTGWTSLMVGSNNPQTGWGPTLDGEWSQADTDCAPDLNNVGVGSRWAGTLDLSSLPNQGQSVLTPSCPTAPQCDCAPANDPASSYSSQYKQFLKMYAEAQMHSFEQAWGWFYWTWKTEAAVQWSWMLGLQAGILPDKAFNPDFDCSQDIPDFDAQGLSEGI